MKKNAQISAENGRKSRHTDADSALAGLLDEDRSTNDAILIDNAWRGAEVSLFIYSSFLLNLSVILLLLCYHGLKTFVFIKASSDILVDMINVVYHDKPSDFIY